MDPQDPGHKMDSELVTNEIEDNQQMYIRVCALNSIVSFALETLVQHCTLIGQLQDEVFALRSKNEELQRSFGSAGGDHSPICLHQASKELYHMHQ
jgi:hypothetical protein